MVKRRPHKHSRCVLRGKEVRRIANERGLRIGELLERSGIYRDQRTLQHWLKGRNRVDIEDAEKLAATLGVGLEKIARVDQVVRIRGGDTVHDLDAEERWLREAAAIGSLLQRPAAVFRHYLRHVALRFWPLRDYARWFSHDGRQKDYYAEVLLTPRSLSGTRGTCQFVFGFSFGPLRIDYGKVLVRRDGTIELLGTFDGHRETASVRGEGPVRVWTWFGREACKFLVRSSEDFDLTVDARPANRDPRNRPDDVVCFPAAPHHLARD